MQSISDEIRHFVERSYKDEHMDPRELLALADRIDAEMVELPLDRDGGPIHGGDTVYREDGGKVEVERIILARDKTTIDFWTCGKNRFFSSSTPMRLIHTRPDSLESIAAELDEMVETADEDTSVYDTCEKLSDFADRIRKLAKEQANE